MISGMFMTKFTNVSAFWRRKFSRSPRLQYSVITSTGPDNKETCHITRLYFFTKGSVFAFKSSVSRQIYCQGLGTVIKTFY